MIDTHCHINDELYKKNPENYIKTAEKAGVFGFVVVGYDLESSREAVRISEAFSNCWAIVGIHPSEVKKTAEKDYEEIKKLASSKKVIGIGEIGLDFYWDKDKEIQEEQKKYFIKQINIANELHLPISIHCRDAIDSCLNILKENKVDCAGIMHCYAGSVESAKEFMKLGFLLGFGGTVTFKNAVKPKEVVSSIPSDSYVLETDSPYLTPHPFRGQDNHSKYLYLVRDQIALLRNIPSDQVEKETTQNFKRVFKIWKKL